MLGPEAYESDPLRAAAPGALRRRAGLRARRRDRAAHARSTPRAWPRPPASACSRELRRLVLAAGVLDGLALADRLGVLRAVLPELTDLHGVEQSHYHHLDVYDHTLEVLARQIELEGRLEEVFGEPTPGASRAVLREPLGRRARRAGRRCASARCCTTSASRPRAASAPTAASRSSATTALGERMVRDLCRRLRTSERFARFVGRADAPPPRARLPRARAPARPAPASTATSRRTDPGGGGGDAALLRRPPRHPRPQGRRRPSPRTSSWRAS